MAYTKIVFQNSPSTATPLNAENLNHMDDQIAINDQRLTEIETSYVKSFNGRKGEVVPENGDYNIGQIAPLSGAQVGQVPVVVNHGTEQDPELVFEMGAGGGGGHSIIDSEGNTMPQESAMQFPDSFVSDDSTNGRTIVENVKELTLAELSQATERGMYLTTDEESVPIGEIEEDYVEVVGDGYKTYSQLFDELFTLIDFDKIRDNSTLVFQMDGYTTTFCITYSSAAWYKFGRVASNNEIDYIDIQSSDSKFILTSLTSSSPYIAFTDVSAYAFETDAKITLHYGSSSGIVELNTDARHCMMSNEQSVEWGMGEKTTLCTIMSAETTLIMTQTSVNYAVQHSGFYSITVVNANNVTHDSDVNIAGYAIAAQYFTYHYQRYSANVPLKAGTQITINGAVGDTVVINYGWGNM